MYGLSLRTHKKNGGTARLGGAIIEHNKEICHQLQYNMILNATLYECIWCTITKLRTSLDNPLKHTFSCCINDFSAILPEIIFKCL